MKITVERFYFSEKCTIGRLIFDGVWGGLYTLEDRFREVADRPVGDWKVPGSTAAPRGSYRVVCSYSHRFHRVLPELLEVPGFTGVRIHPGNTSADTEGCILVGRTWEGGDAIFGSRDAFEKDVYPKIRDTESVELEILCSPS